MALDGLEEVSDRQGYMTVDGFVKYGETSVCSPGC